MFLDMHIHTIGPEGSDGLTTDDILLEHVIDNKPGDKIIAVSNHDIVSRKIIGKIREKGGITFEATEISTKNHEHNKSVHELLYARSICSQVDEILSNTREQKLLMIINQINHLNSLGFEIDIQDFFNFSCLLGKTIDSINKFNIVKYIFSNKINIDLLYKINSGILTEEDFYYGYLKKTGLHYNEYGFKVGDYEPKIQKIAELKEECSGILSFAHPNFSFNRIEEFAEVLPHHIKEGGVNAIEINTKATKIWVEALIELGKTHGLYHTFGSDNHNIYNPSAKQGNLGELNPHLDEDFVKRSFDKYAYKLL